MADWAVAKHSFDVRTGYKDELDKNEGSKRFFIILIKFILLSEK
jgi:hypothetical protein